VSPTLLAEVSSAIAELSAVEIARPSRLPVLKGDRNAACRALLSGWALLLGVKLG